MLNNKAVVPVRMCKTLGFYSRLFLVPKPGKKWRPVIHLIVLNKHLLVPTFKMETAEVTQNAICKGEWVVSIDLTDAYFHIPIHEKSQHLLRFHVAVKIYQFRALPFSIATAPFEFTRVVKEVKPMLQNRGTLVHQYLDHWLLRAPSVEICLEESKQLITFIQELGWVINFQKSELKPTQKFDFLGYRFDLSKGEISPTEKEMAYFDYSHRRSKQQFDNNSQDPDVVYRHSGISGEDSANGQVTYETLPVVPENPWGYPQSLDKKIPCSEILKRHLIWWKNPKKCVDRLSPTCRGTKSPVVHRCIGQGLGCTFGKPNSQWNVVGHRGKFVYKHSGIESSFSGNKVFSNPSIEQEGSGGLKQCHSSVLPQQARGDPLLTNVSNDMVPDGILQPQGNFVEGSAHPGLFKYKSRQSFTQGQNHTNRMVSSSQDFSDDLPNLTQTNGRYVCIQNEQQTTSLCISSPRSKCNGGRCIEYLVGGTRRLCLLSNSSHSKNDSKNENLCLPNDCSSPRVARDELILGPDRLFHKTSTTTSTLGNSSQTTIQSKVSSKSTIYQSLCLVSGFETKSPKKFSQSEAERIKAPQRFSSRRVYESRWADL